MRIYYLFEIKDKVLNNYKNNYEELYKLLESIRYLKTEDILLGYSIFNNIVIPIDKDKYNDYIKNENLNKDTYICYNYTHTINEFYSNESTKMIINNSHIRIKTNMNIPSFFFDIMNLNNIFVCDFDNKDYFLLNETIFNPLHKTINI